VWIVEFLTIIDISSHRNGIETISHSIEISKNISVQHPQSRIFGQLFRHKTNFCSIPKQWVVLQLSLPVLVYWQRCRDTMRNARRSFIFIFKYADHVWRSYYKTECLLGKNVKKYLPSVFQLQDLSFQFFFFNSFSLSLSLSLSIYLSFTDAFKPSLVYYFSSRSFPVSLIPVLR
jgi:hypothetical protein